MSEITVHHKHIDTPKKAFGYGLLEGFGKTLGCAIALGLLLLGLDVYGDLRGDDKETSTIETSN